MPSPDPSEKRFCKTCEHWYPSTPKYFHRDPTKSGGLFPECAGCKTYKQRDLSLSKELKVKERQKLDAHIRWFIEHMPEYLTSAQQKAVMARAKEEADWDLGWSVKEPTQQNGSSRPDTGPTQEELDQMIRDLGGGPQ